MKNSKLTLLLLFFISTLIISCYKEPMDYSKSINDLKAQVTALQNRSDSLANALKITNNNISSISKTIDSIKVQLTTINSQLLQLNSQLTGINANIALITAQITTLNQQYATLLAQLNALILCCNTNKISNLSWSKISSGDCLNVVEGQPGTLFLSRRTDQLKSTDNGQTWTNTNWPLGIVRSSTSLHPGLAYSNFGGGMLATAALDNGWYISTNNGNTYQATGATGFGTGSPEIITLSDGRFIAGQGGFLRGIYKSSGIDNKTWVLKYQNSNVDIYSFSIFTDDTLYACGYGVQPLLVSTNKGESWSALLNAQETIDFVCTYGDSLLMVNRTGDLTVSKRTNFSRSSTIRSNIGNNVFHTGSFSSSDKILVLTGSLGIYVSNDFGRSFFTYAIPSATTYNKIAIIGNYIYANTDVGLFRTLYK